jgi:hypothetical protein
MEAQRLQFQQATEQVAVIALWTLLQLPAGVLVGIMLLTQEPEITQVIQAVQAAAATQAVGQAGRLAVLAYLEKVMLAVRLTQ